MLAWFKQLIQPFQPKVGFLSERRLDEKATGEKEETSVIYREGASGKIPDSARQLLEQYSKIPPDDVEAHVYKIVCLMNPIPNQSELTSSQERPRFQYSAISMHWSPPLSGSELESPSSLPRCPTEGQRRPVVFGARDLLWPRTSEARVRWRTV